MVTRHRNGHNESGGADNRIKLNFSDPAVRMGRKNGE